MNTGTIIGIGAAALGVAAVGVVAARALDEVLHPHEPRHATESQPPVPTGTPVTAVAAAIIRRSDHDRDGMVRLERTPYDSLIATASPDAVDGFGRADERIVDYAGDVHGDGTLVARTDYRLLLDAATWVAAPGMQLGRDGALDGILELRAPRLASFLENRYDANADHRLNATEISHLRHDYPTQVVDYRSVVSMVPDWAPAVPQLTERDLVSDHAGGVQAG